MLVPSAFLVNADIRYIGHVMVELIEMNWPSTLQVPYARSVVIRSGDEPVLFLDHLARIDRSRMSVVHFNFNLEVRFSSSTRVCVCVCVGEKGSS